jgi:hypothetical protein
VTADNLTFAGLVVLPLVVVVCLGLFVRSLVGHGRTRWLWLLAAVVLGAVWFFFVSEALLEAPVQTTGKAA